MLFFLILGLFVTGWVAAFLLEHAYYDKAACCCVGASIIIGIVLTMMIVAIVGGRLTKDIDTQVLTQQEKSLRYQVESNVYKYDDSARQILANRVTEWNCSLAANQARKDNFWIGIFYPIDYNQFDYISVEFLGGHDE